MAEADDELQRRVTELEERVTRLENHPAQAPETGTGQESVFWALNELKQRLDDRGGVLFTGSAPLPTGETYEWQEGATAADLVESDWSESSEVLEALGHPVRLLLLQRVLSGTTATADLKNDQALGTTGQLYHHLRRLVAAGWLRTKGRGHYRVPPARVVPLLTVLLAARR
ncbi:DNA-binding HxlR family transcriptional regulator [Lipingzhangella halophila]|uniref:DNA-binding HxlR family transcriptional regulator n=1 Tax=Lipingzhangella halophila TaxID=1783352 RepID=A0A7W7W2K4_9ACTN|nr:ArsR family transcriptional regulator [Lipingzhangella halophila]MBB4932052.1 DNA-binding HxlR family transcriptional regulator [Lipingzhangella halophila]